MCGVDAVGGGLQQCRRTRLVGTDNTDQADRHPELGEPDGLVGTFTTEHLPAGTDRLSAARLWKLWCLQHQIASDLSDDHHTHRNTLLCALALPRSGFRQTTERGV